MSLPVCILGAGNWGTTIAVMPNTSPPLEWSACFINKPCRRLQLSISFPEGYIPSYIDRWVWMTENSGQSWTLIAGTAPANLPAIHVSSIAIHPNQPGWLYAATDLGVFASENNGQSWSASTEGPASSAGPRRPSRWPRHGPWRRGW